MYNSEKQEKYIKVRISQLQEDAEKANDSMDKAWYNRLIQELDWVLQMGNTPTHNCFMGSGQGKSRKVRMYE